MGGKHPILPLLFYSFSVKHGKLLTSNVSSFVTLCTVLTKRLYLGAIDCLGRCQSLI